MESNCTTPDYDLIYAPYLKNPGKLLDLAHYDPEKDTLIDLCGGTGVASREALRRRHELTQGYAGPKIWLVDLNPRMDDHTLAPHVMSIPADVNGRLWPCTAKRANVVVCRQALGYINNLRDFIRHVAMQALAEGGNFVFNTFAEAPRFRCKKYVYNDLQYREFGCTLFGVIHHIQAVKVGNPYPEKPRWHWDYSRFQHHEPDLIEDALSMHFNWRRTQEGNSLYYTCTHRRPE